MITKMSCLFSALLLITTGTLSLAESNPSSPSQPSNLSTASQTQAFTREEARLLEQILVQQQQSYQALSEAKLDNIQAQHNQELQSLDKRIDDALFKTAQAVDRFTANTTWIAILVTIVMGAVVAVIAFLSFFTVKRIAKDQAQQAIQEWIKDNEKQLNEKLDELAKLAESAKLDEEEKYVSVRMAKGQRIDPRQILLLKELAQKTAQSKPKEEYTFNDWNIQALAAAAEGNWQDAATGFERAAGAYGASKVDRAMAMVYKGVALDRAKKAR